METVLSVLLPFLLLLVFWLVLMRRFRSGRMSNPMLDKLEEIREELEHIRRALEQREFR